MLAEAALGAIAQAIVQSDVDNYDFEPRARQWLGRDPIQLALKKAFARTYAAFARQYPDLAAGLFNESFLQPPALSDTCYGSGLERSSLERLRVADLPGPAAALDRAQAALPCL